MGVMYDSEISASRIHRIQEDREHVLYFEMIGIHPDWQKSRRAIFSLLMKSIIEFSYNLESENIRVNAVCANGFSAEGASLCRALGLSAISKSVQGGEIYWSADIAAIRKVLTRLQRHRLQRLPAPHSV